MNDSDRYRHISPVAPQALERYMRGIDAAPVYSKSLPPPEGEPWLETATGLKYWRFYPGPTIGRQASVLTEDPEISMHVYGGGGRDDYGSYLFCYKGTRIGFITHKLVNGLPPPIYEEYPRDKIPEDRDPGQRITYRRITAVGTPVFDHAYKFIRDANGRPVRGADGRYIRKSMFEREDARKDAWVTGLTWDDFRRGKRDRFPSRQVQDEMIVLWPCLFNGLIGTLREMRATYNDTLPNGSRAWRGRMRFDESVVSEFRNGDLIDV